MQGFLIAEPMDPTSFIDWLQHYHPPANWLKLTP
jgi:hypothetical protein